MICLLAASVVGSWTYAGFLNQPTPPPKPPQASAPEVPAIEPKPASKPEPEPEPEPELEAPASKPTEATIPKLPEVSAPTPPGPTLYQSTDASGQTWEHPDRSYLASFVEARNRTFARPIYFSPQPSRASRCFNGRCN